MSVQAISIEVMMGALIPNCDIHPRLDRSIAIRDKVSEANNAEIKMRDLKKLSEERLKEASDSQLRAAADSFTKHLNEVEASTHQGHNQSGAGPS